MITWTPEFETGHHIVDADHKRLVEGLNALELAMKEGAGKEKIGEMIAFLNSYARDHFKREEQYMKLKNCPAHMENAREHAVFVGRLNEWVRRLQTQASVALVLEVHRETAIWIRNHIMKVDCKLRGCHL